MKKFKTTHPFYFLLIKNRTIYYQSFCGRLAKSIPSETNFKHSVELFSKNAKTQDMKYIHFGLSSGIPLLLERYYIGRYNALVFRRVTTRKPFRNSLELYKLLKKQL